MLVSEKILQVPPRKDERWAFLPTFLEQVSETVEKVLARSSDDKQELRYR
jgi:hypothetical protein